MSVRNRIERTIHRYIRVYGERNRGSVPYGVSGVDPAVQRLILSFTEVWDR